MLGYVPPEPPEGIATWYDYSRSLPPEQRDSWFACTTPRVPVRGCTSSASLPGRGDGMQCDDPDELVEIDESVSSALALIGRVTGTDVAADWFQARHSRVEPAP